MNYRYLYFLIVSVIASTFHISVNAAQTGDSLAISFTGRLFVHKECIINDNKLITVDFGSVGVNKVGTGEAVKAVDYSISCVGSSETNSIQMTIKATPVPGYPNEFPASISGLRIKILNEGQIQELNKPFSIADWRNPPKLEVQLDKDPEVTLEAANFSGTATLMAEYF